MDLVLLAATRPWTYWIAPALVVTAVCAVVAMAYAYYRNVLVPYYRMLDHRASQEASPTADLTRLDDRRRARPRSVPRRLAA